MRIVEQSVQLEWATPEPELVIERAGRTCYKSEDKITEGSAAKFVAMVLARGHESVIEHATASVRIVCDRGISHEIVRHRLCSYSQESTRYCTYGSDEGISVIEPPWLVLLVSPPHGHSADVWQDACLAAEKSYQELLRIGQSPQIARSVLPTCLKTELVMTCNFREWRHFLRLRWSPKAHPQIQEIARMIYKELVKLSPACFHEFEELSR